MPLETRSLFWMEKNDDTWKQCLPLLLFHYSQIQKSGSVYIGHITPYSSSPEDIVTHSIISYLSSCDISLEKLVVVLTAVNTGWKNSPIRQIQIHLRKPLQWTVYPLDFNELPFRHLFQYLTVNQRVRNLWNLQSGKKLCDYEKRPVISFDSIVCQIPQYTEIY